MNKTTLEKLIGKGVYIGIFKGSIGVTGPLSPSGEGLKILPNLKQEAILSYQFRGCTLNEKEGWNEIPIFSDPKRLQIMFNFSLKFSTLTEMYALLRRIDHDTYSYAENIKGHHTGYELWVDVPSIEVLSSRLVKVSLDSEHNYRLREFQIKFCAKGTIEYIS